MFKRIKCGERESSRIDKSTGFEEKAKALHYIAMSVKYGYLSQSLASIASSSNICCLVCN